MNLRCRLGVHSWNVSPDVKTWPETAIWFLGVARECRRCGKRQVGVCDMCYGGTIWETPRQCVGG